MLCQPGWPPMLSPPRRMSKTSGFKEKVKVKIDGNGNEISSNHRCCAERRLLEGFIEQARRHGVSGHARTAWVRRKCGSHILVWRTRADGTPACATPCPWCQRELVKYDLTVHCSQPGEAWYSGRLCAPAAPKAQLTSGQRRHLRLLHAPPSKAP